MPRSVLAAVTIGVGVAVTLGACGSSGGKSSDAVRPAAATTPLPTSTTSNPDADVIAGYLAARAAYNEAAGATGLPVNSEYPALSDHMTGNELAHVKTYITGLRLEGFRLKP